MTADTPTITVWVSVARSIALPRPSPQQSSRWAAPCCVRRFILLHDPAGNDAWGGTFRCVTFARADVEPEMAADPSLPTVGWSWLTDALESHGGEYIAPSGSVTVVHTEGFGEMAADGSDAQIEVRASWTPSSDDMGAHISAWSDLLCAIAGLPPLAPGVIPLQPRRRGTR